MKIHSQIINMHFFSRIYKILAFFLISVLSLPAAVFAAENEFTSKTYLKFYQDARDNRYTPLYEYVELESRNLQNGRVNLYLSGWVGHDFETRQFGNKTRDELTYAFFKVLALCRQEAVADSRQAIRI